LGCIENGQSFGRLAGDRGVGTFGGSEDHVAMLCAQGGSLKQYAYCPVRAERTIPLPPDYLLAIGCSGVVAEKTRAARERYNRLSQLTRAILDAWHAATGRDDPHLAAAVASMPDAIDRLRCAIRTHATAKDSVSELLRRLEHFLAESEQIVPAVPDQLQGSGLREFGGLVDRSQELAEKLLGNQTPETIYLARAARQLGAIAASAFGAGFGGSVWALIGRDDADEFLARWQDSYAQQFAAVSHRAEFFLTLAGPPVIALQGGSSLSRPG
jgi:galactokinase